MKQITKLYKADAQLADIINNELKDNTNWEIFKVIPTFMTAYGKYNAVLVVFNINPTKKRLIEDYNPFEKSGGIDVEQDDYLTLTGVEETN